MAEIHNAITHCPPPTKGPVKTIDTCLRTARNYNPKHSQKNGYRHFSFVIQQNKLIEWGTNMDGPHMCGYKPYQKFHSENCAYFRAQGLLDRKKPFEVINIRLNRRGELRLSKPCDCCTSWLQKQGCRKIIFSVGDAGFAYILF